MSEIRFFRLSSNSTDPCALTRAAYQDASTTWLCQACAEPRPGTGPIDVVIKEERPDDTCLNFIAGTGIGVIQADFLEALQKSGAHHLEIGQVKAASGASLNGFRTFHGDPRTLVRGNENVAYRRCTDCARVKYYAAGKKYLCPEPPSDFAIRYSDQGRLVVTVDVMKNVLATRRRKLVVDQLPVLAKPLDGLPTLI